jgi:hypothetical protein
MKGTSPSRTSRALRGLRLTATECHDGELELLASRNFVFIYSLVLWRGKSMTAIVTISIDLAKNVFAIHGVDATGKPALVRPSVPRAKLLEIIASIPA